MSRHLSWLLVNKLWVTLAHPFALHHLNIGEVRIQDLWFIARGHYGWATPLGTSSYQNIFLCVASNFKNWIDFPSLSQASCLFVLFLVLTNFLFEDRRSLWNSDVQFSQRILLFNFFSFVIVFFSLGGVGGWGNRILLTSGTWG